MPRFIARRLLLAIPIILGVSLVVFATVKIMPGDPVAALLGPHASARARAALYARYGLDKTVPLQYVTWLFHAARGDLGSSISRGTSVLPIVRSALNNTLVLTFSASVISLVGGVILAVIAAFGPARVARRMASFIGIFSVSMPQYSLGVVLIVVFSAHLHWAPAGGMHDVINGGKLWQHLVLPSIAASAIPMGIIARMFSAALLETQSADWVDNLRARGLSRARLLYHFVRGSAASLLTIAGLQIGYLLGGVIYVEVIFAWPGLGNLIYDSISKRDLPVIQAGVLVSALAFVLINIIVDVSRAALDPRLRQAATGE
jgi:peptide/nickel transport system permease protein